MGGWVGGERERERAHFDQLERDVPLIQLSHGMLSVVAIDTGITHQIQVLLQQQSHDHHMT